MEPATLVVGTTLQPTEEPGHDAVLFLTQSLAHGWGSTLMARELPVPNYVHMGCVEEVGDHVTGP